MSKHNRNNGTGSVRSIEIKINVMLIIGVEPHI